jgi:hypothetical protein
VQKTRHYFAEVMANAVAFTHMISIDIEILSKTLETFLERPRHSSGG